MEKLWEETQGALNIAIESCHSQGIEIRDSLFVENTTLQQEVVALWEEFPRMNVELEDVKSDLMLCNMTVI